MKPILKSTVVIIAMTAAYNSLSQPESNRSRKKTMDMETSVEMNKQVIRKLYEVVLNQKTFDIASDIVADDYKNAAGEHGPEAFLKGLKSVVAAFPDARWTPESVVAEGNTVIVKQTLTGTHKSQFQNIPATGRTILNDGFALYELSEGKIIRHEVLTDRLTFLQQLGVLPQPGGQNNDHVYFVDRFVVPKNAVAAFADRMNYNRDIIKTIPGFIRDEVIISELDNGDLSIMTIAVWLSQEHLDSARNIVQEEYRKIGFDPHKFTKQLNIITERQLYRPYHQ